MKNGAANLIRNDGTISANKTVALGTCAPTKSTAADKITTYRILFKSPKAKKDMKINLDRRNKNGIFTRFLPLSIPSWCWGACFFF